MVNNINNENNTNDNNNFNNSLTNQQLQVEVQSFDLPTTFTKYMNNTVGANMLNCDFEMNDTKLVGVDIMMTNGECGSEIDDTITDNTTFELNNLNSNKFKNKLSHPLSSSILKTTKSILDSSENNPNFNTYGTSSNDSIDNSTATNTLNYNILLEQTAIISSNDNTINSININNNDAVQKESGNKQKSILKQRNKSSSSKNHSIKDSSNSNNNYNNMDNTLSPQPNNVSYFKMFESFLCEKKASFKSGIRSIQNMDNSLSSKNSNKQNQKIKSFTTPPMRATLTDPKTPIKADLVTISSLVSEANNNGFLTVNIDQESKLNNKTHPPKVSPIYSLHSSSIHSSISSSIISPTSSFLVTEANKNNNYNINNNNNNPFEDLEEEDNDIITLNNQNYNIDFTSSAEQEDNITKTNDNDFTISINNSNIMNTPIANNEKLINCNTNNLSVKPRLNNINNNTSNVINYKFKPRGESIISNTIHKVELRSVFLKVGDIDTLNEKFFAEAFIEVNIYQLIIFLTKKFYQLKNLFLSKGNLD
jgi:hypothetical protein